jgi:hypothetical protein
MSSAATTEIDDFKIATEEEVFGRFPEVELYDGEIHQKNMHFFKHLVSPEILVSLDRRKNLFDQLNKIIKDEKLLTEMCKLNVANFNKYYEDIFINNIETWLNFAGEKHEKMGMSLVMCVHH